MSKFDLLEDPQIVKSKVAIVHHNLGPYHVARLKCLEKELEKLTVIELASNVDIRAWKRFDKTDLDVITLVNDSLNAVSARELTEKLIGSLEKIQPECLIVAGYAHPSLRAAARWAKKADCPVVLLSESQTVDRKRNYIKEKLKSFWIKRFYSCAFVSGARAASYLETLNYPGNRIWRGYSVVDNSHFSRYLDNDGVSAKLGLDGLPDKYFLYVGRFSPEKNLARLLHAYKAYVDKAGSGSWSLVLLGGGPQEQELRRLCEKLGLEKVYWPGFKQIDELPLYYASASAFVLPSLLEPWGLVVNEAMAAGLPVIVSNNCGCVLDLVDQGINGAIIDPYDVGDIAIKMFRFSLIFTDSDLVSMGKASRRIIANHSIITWAKTLADCVSVAKDGV
jgi:glycosyltransferase involved in cell wall biosynthesis